MQKFTEATKVHFDLAPGQIKQVPVAFAKDHMTDIMKKLGFGGSLTAVREMANAYGMDSVQGLVTPAAIPNLVQFLQNWLPGQVYVMTAAREIDNLIGITTQGEWSDEQIVQQVLE